MNNNLVPNIGEDDLEKMLKNANKAFKKNDKAEEKENKRLEKIFHKPVKITKKKDVKIILKADTGNISKESVFQKGNEIIKLVLEGKQSPLELFANISFLEDVLSTAKEQIKDACLTEIKHFKTGECIFGDSEINFVNGRCDLNYSDDQTYKKLEKQLSDRKAFIKLANQANQSNASLLDNETGELFLPVSQKYGKDYLTFKINKSKQ